MDIPKLGLIFTFPHKDDITVNDVHGYGYTHRFSVFSLGMGTGHEVWTHAKTCTHDSGYGYESHYCHAYCLAMAL
jgi:hypothetical protein